jgi:hypothetical protein
MASKPVTLKCKTKPIDSLGAGQSSIQILKDTKMATNSKTNHSVSLATIWSKPDIDNTYVRVCGRLVKKSFLNRVWNHANDRYDLFQMGVAYTASEICGDLFWNQLTNDESKMADLCICDFIEQGELPMAKIANSPNGSHQYCLI